MAKYFLLQLSLGAFVLCSTAIFAFDPQPLQDFCVADTSNSVRVNGVTCKDPSAVQADDFFFSGLNAPGNTSNPYGSKVKRVVVDQLAGLNTLGISMAHLEFAPGGENTPHVHPRASEIQTVLEGSLLVGFVTSNPDNRFFTKLLQKGDVFVYPMGLIHFQKNVGYGNAVAVSILNSQNHGAITMANAAFDSSPAIDSDILAKAFQMDKNTMDQMKSKL